MRVTCTLFVKVQLLQPLSEAMSGFPDRGARVYHQTLRILGAIPSIHGLIFLMTLIKLLLKMMLMPVLLPVMTIAV